MKTAPSLRHGLGLTLLSLVVAGLGLKAAAETVSTVPVGAVTKNIPIGLTALGITLLEPSLVTGTCTTNTSTALTLEGQANIGILLGSGEQYYIEVMAGVLEGDRFDVDTAATITAGNASIVLKSESLNNTLNLNAGDLVSNVITLRKHITLEKLAGDFTPALLGNNNQVLADQILFYNAINNSFTAYYLRGDGVTWRQVGGVDPVGKSVVIAPGVGVLIQKRFSATKLVSVGSVRANDFAMPMAIGKSFKSPGYPISFSPSSLGATLINGWTGNNNQALADQIQIFNPLNNSFTAYYLRGDGVTWRQVGGINAETLTQIVDFSGAYLLVRKNSDPDSVLNLPYSL